jgi:hypothetical protein
MGWEFFHAREKVKRGEEIFWIGVEWKQCHCSSAWAIPEVER